VVAAVLLWTRDGLAGAWLLVAAMAGSLVFGLLYHFVVPGADNVFTQPPGPWRTTFRVTAVLLAPLQVIGGSVGFWAARRVPRSSTTGFEKRSSGGLGDSRGGPRSEPRRATTRGKEDLK
jgi:uncharacterized membrane protein YsdA (DUF1294 family)